MSFSLLTCLPHELVELVPDLTEHEARRILSLGHRHGQLPPITPAGIRRQPYLAARKILEPPLMEVIETQPSRIDPFVKYGFRTHDGHVVEAVRIPLERPHRFVVCVSSQVGCAIGCAFCGTAKLGLQRSLAAWEIVEQVRIVRAGLQRPDHVHGVVFQGMGEPLANLTEVLRAIQVMSDSSALAIDARNITVCTSGIASAFARMFEAAPNIRMALSIGSALPEKRVRLIPVERTHPLTTCLDLLADQAKRVRIAPLLAYTLLDGVNDTDEDLEALCVLLQRFADRAELRPRVSLLAYNRIGPGDPFSPCSAERSEHFRSVIGAHKIPVVRRYSGGADIDAACGQLGLRHQRG